MLRVLPTLARKGSMNPLGLFWSGRAGRRLLVALGVVPLLIVAVHFAPTVSAVLLGCLAGLLLIEALLSERALRRVAASLAFNGTEPKLEVGGGALGELCHQINRVVQQRRAQQRLLAMLPSPPPAVAARLADLVVPPDGLMPQIAVLAIRLPGGNEPTADALQLVAAETVRQAALYGALLSRSGNVLLLSFGALGGTPDTAVRSAYRAAFGLHADWQDRPMNARPAVCLTSGVVEAVLVPGLGYTLIGPPLNEAVALLATATADTLYCDEAIYLHLRRLGAITIPLTATIPPSRRQSYTIPFG
jgi:hypothetical protein